MNRTQYKQARRLIRDNGNYALRWLEPDHAEIMHDLQAGKDKLAERASIVAYCRRENIDYNFRHLA